MEVVRLEPLSDKILDPDQTLMTIRHLAVSALAVFFASSVTAQEWTRFRGPNGTGVSDAKTIPTQWTEADYNWKTQLPGIGHSSPVEYGGRVFLMSADPENATRYVICVSGKTGEKLWVKEFPSDEHHLHVRSSYASCTPAVDGEYVYVAWSTPARTTFKAFDHFGEEVWSNDLGTWQSQHGFGTSPMLFGDLVVLSNSQQANQLKPGQKPGKSFMMAFDRSTGNEVWRTPRESHNVCYSVPFIHDLGNGKSELVCISTGEGFYALDPETGKENWSIEAFSMRTVGSPIKAGGLIFGSTGSGKGGNYVTAVSPGKNAKIEYQIKTAAPYVPSMLAKDDLVFLWYDKGILTCIDAKTGTVHYKKRLDTAFSGSPVLVGDMMYCIDEAGVVFVVAAKKEFELIAKNELGEDSRATPAIADGKMLLRTYSHLISIGGHE